MAGKLSDAGEMGKFVLRSFGSRVSDLQNNNATPASPKIEVSSRRKPGPIGSLSKSGSCAGGCCWFSDHISCCGKLICEWVPAFAGMTYVKKKKQKGRLLRSALPASGMRSPQKAAASSSI